MSKGETISACASKQYQVTRKNLPVSCPMPDMTKWNAHPRVWLAIEETGKASCPYCSARYTLTDFQFKEE